MARRETVKAIFVTTITVTDPDSGVPVKLEVWKDPRPGGGMLAMDSSFLDEVRDRFPNPFNPVTLLVLDRDDIPTTDPEEKGVLHQCQNCLEQWTDEQIVPLHEVTHLLKRVAPREPMPSGECPDPECRALCQPVPGSTRRVILERCTNGGELGDEVVRIPMDVPNDEVEAEAIRRAQLKYRLKGGEIPHFRFQGHRKEALQNGWGYLPPVEEESTGLSR